MDLNKFKKIKLLVLDFDGVMTDNRVLVSEDGKEAVFCDRADGFGVKMLQKKGVEVVVISQEKNNVVQIRCKKLNILCWNGIDDKIGIFSREILKKGLKKEEVCFVGNDINDLDCISAAGIGIAVADSYKEILEAADYITQKKGGMGAVREVAELILGNIDKE